MILNFSDIKSNPSFQIILTQTLIQFFNRISQASSWHFFVMQIEEIQQFLLVLISHLTQKPAVGFVHQIVWMFQIFESEGFG